MICVQTGKLEAAATTLKQCKQTLQHIQYLQYSLHRKLPLAKSLQSELNELIKQINESLCYVQDSLKSYIETERRLTKQAQEIERMSKKPYQFMKSDVRVHSTLDRDRSLVDFIKNGICVGVFGGLDVVSFRKEVHSKYASGGIKGALGSVDASFDAKGMLFDGKRFSPSAKLEAGFKAAIGSVGMFANIGNSWLSAAAKGDVYVGSVRGEAKAVISKDEVTLKADVGASAIRGEVEGSIQLFGIKITLTGIGEVGSIGANAEFSSKKGELTFGTSASLLAGLGFKVRVNY